MIWTHAHATACKSRCLCHLNPTAQARYYELMAGGCPEQADALASRGAWS